MKKNGFTLIEVLVVVAIFALLSVLTIASLNSNYAKMRDARRISDVIQIQSGLELYFNDQSFYPLQADNAFVLGRGEAITFSSLGGWSTEASGRVYMNQVPSDPKVDNYYVYQVNDFDNSAYEIRFKLEKDNDNWGTGRYCKAVPGSITCSASF